MESFNLEAINQLLNEKRFQDFHKLAEHNLEIFFKVVCTSEVSPVLIRHNLISKKLTTFQLLNLISDETWANLLFTNNIYSVLDLNTYKKSSYGIRHFLSKRGNKINNILSEKVFKKIAESFNEDEIINTTLERYTYYREVPIQTKIYIEKKSLKKTIQRKLKNKQNKFAIQKSKTEFLKQATLQDDDILHFLISNKISTHTELYSANSYLHHHAAQNVTLQKKIMKLYPAFFIHHECRSKTKLRTRELADYFLEEIKKTNHRNLKLVNFPKANFLLHKKKFWIASIYVRANLDGIESILNLLLKKTLNEIVIYFRELEITPDSNEWSKYKHFFDLKCPKFYRNLSLILKTDN